MGHASSIFNGASDTTLYNRITPAPEQREFLQVQWNALADALKPRLVERSGYPVSTWLQGSYKFGTLLKPIHKGEEYDVDVGIYFEWDVEARTKPSARQLRDWVQDELLEYSKAIDEIEEVVEPAKERCSRAIYAQQFHIDTPVYHLDRERDLRRLACQSNTWEGNDPKAIYKWFKDVVDEDDRDQLRRLVRYLKAWAAVTFAKDSPSRPSSIFLTVVAAQAYKQIRFWQMLTMADDDALIAVIKAVYERLLDSRQVPNPVDENEDLNRMDDEGWEGFTPKLRALHECACEAETAADEMAAALAWSQAFSYLMPLPDAEELEVVEEGTGNALMIIPEIDVEVYERNPRRLVARHRNEVPFVGKDRDLVFRIANPHVLPLHPTIEWTVRNAGEEADQIGDLGHRAIGVDLLTHEESTAYSGRHSMDCLIRGNGQVHALRRVPVNISALPNPVRNPARPAFTKLRTLRRRRR